MKTPSKFCKLLLNLRKISLILLLSTHLCLLAQPGALDMSFNPDDTGNGSGDGVGGEVYCTGIQNDGKILIGGWFSVYNGVSIFRLARLNTNGSLDNTFQTGTGVGGSPVECIQVQNDGKIIIGGGFPSYNDLPVYGIARINSNGVLDNTFNTGSGVDGEVDAMAIQNDGKIIIGGYFSGYNGTAAGNIARINQNGTIDNSFNSGLGANDWVYSVALQADGKILVGGWFTTYNGISSKYLVRLNSNGSIDNSFNTGTGPSFIVYSIAVQDDGKILIGGNFNIYNGVAANRIARLNTDGSIDTTFTTGAGFSGPVRSIKCQSDGKILAGGYFSTCNNMPYSGLVRLNTNGSIDTSFATGTGTNGGIIRSINLQNDQRIIIGGPFTTFNNVTKNRIARLHTNGNVDLSFNPSTSANDEILAVKIQNDGKILIGGWFTSYNDITNRYIARLNTDGSLDNSFNTGNGANWLVKALALQTDSKILAGGEFTNFDNKPVNRLVRLNADGTYDTTFNTGSGANNIVNAIAVQNGGKILVGGRFPLFNNDSVGYCLRLNTDGTKDSSFLVGAAADGPVEYIGFQPDGKILICGEFTHFNNFNRSRIARLNIDGSVDTTFTTGYLPNSVVYAAAVQNNGKIIVGGSLSALYRLNSDGSHDASFNPGIPFNYQVLDIIIQPDEKIIIGGVFTEIGGQQIRRIARLNPDGTIDTLFNSPYEISGHINKIALQNDSRILIAGGFRSYNNTGRNRIARLLNCETTSTTVNYVSCDSIIFNGVSYGSSGIYNHTLTAETGCDSIVALNLVVLPQNTGFINETACNNYTLNGQTFTSTGTYMLINTEGCDTVTLNLNIVSNSYKQITDTSCGIYYLNAQAYTNSGTFTQMLTNQNGCDSIITLELTILPVPPAPGVTQSGDTLFSSAPQGNQWYNAYGILPGETNTFYVVQENGSYYVRVIINGCISDYSMYININTSIENSNNDKDIKIFPNPVQDIATFVYTSDRTQQIKINIFNMLGQETLSLNAGVNEGINEILLNTKEFKRGMYFVIICDEGNNTERVKLILD